MTPLLHIDRAEGIEAPDDDSFSCWVGAALVADPQRSPPYDPEISLRVADRDEVATLNHAYRGKSGPTNVLSFPTDLPEGVESGLLGDIVICAPLVEREALEQGKPLDAHWAHLTIHGVLHLLGHDHLIESEAEAMEALEVETLAQLGYADPYSPPPQTAEGGLSAS